MFKRRPNKLAAQRVAVGLTQDALAAALGVSQQSISAYEQGQRRIPARLAGKYRKLLGLSRLEWRKITKGE